MVIGKITYTLLSKHSQSFDWDANGNMTQHDQRSLCWDEENRLAAVMDSKSMKSSTLRRDGDEVNIPRTSSSSLPKSTTYQTYIIIIEKSSMATINQMKQ